MSFVNMSSHSVGCLFILQIFPFAMQKLFNLMQSHLFIFSFVSFACGDIYNKILLRAISKILLPMFSSRIFVVSGIALLITVNNGCLCPSSRSHGNKFVVKQIRFIACCYEGAFIPWETMGVTARKCQKSFTVGFALCWAIVGRVEGNRVFL